MTALELAQTSTGDVDPLTPGLMMTALTAAEARACVALPKYDTVTLGGPPIA